MNRGILILVFLWHGFVSAVCAAESRPPYLDPNQPLESRVEDLLSKLTVDEKISLLHGDSKFTTAAIPRLTIALCLVVGPTTAGFRRAITAAARRWWRAVTVLLVLL